MDSSAAYTAMLLAMATAMGAIGTFFKVETQRRGKLQRDMDAAFKKIRRLEVKVGIPTEDPTAENEEEV